MSGGVGFLLPTSFMADWQGTSLRLDLLAVSIPATTRVFLAVHRFFSLNTHQAWRSKQVLRKLTEELFEINIAIFKGKSTL